VGRDPSASRFASRVTFSATISRPWTECPITSSLTIFGFFLARSYGSSRIPPCSSHERQTT
jgi:hypothetical protein